MPTDKSPSQGVTTRLAWRSMVDKISRSSTGRRSPSVEAFTARSMRYALEQNKLAPGKDVTVIQLGDQNMRFTVLTVGSVQSTLISPPFDITAKKLGYNVLGDMADFGLPYQHETVATTDRFLKERPETARKFLRAFVAGIHVWMTDEKTTKQILAKRLKIADKEILDATYLAYKKLTEKKLIRR
jgi:ABC-type nitrate/sulfonate/bicarbonate transport system substrate-binding protein